MLVQTHNLNVPANWPSKRDSGEPCLGKLDQYEVQQTNHTPKVTPAKFGDGYLIISLLRRFLRRLISLITGDSGDDRRKLKDIGTNFRKILDYASKNHPDKIIAELALLERNIKNLPSIDYKTLEADIKTFTRDLNCAEIGNLVQILHEISKNHPKLNQLLEISLQLISEKIMLTMESDYRSILAESNQIKKDSPKIINLREKLRASTDEYFSHLNNKKATHSLNQLITAHIHTQLIKKILNEDGLQKEIFTQSPKKKFNNGKERIQETLNYSMQEYLKIAHILIPAHAEATLNHMISLFSLKDLIRLENIIFSNENLAAAAPPFPLSLENIEVIDFTSAFADEEFSENVVKIEPPIEHTSEIFFDSLQFEIFLTDLKKLIHSKTEAQRSPSHSELIGKKFKFTKEKQTFTEILQQLIRISDTIDTAIKIEAKNSYGYVKNSDDIGIEEKTAIAEFIWTQAIKDKPKSELEFLRFNAKIIDNFQADFLNILPTIAIDAETSPILKKINEDLQLAAISLQAICAIFENINTNNEDTPSSKYITWRNQYQNSNRKTIGSKISKTSIPSDKKESNQTKELTAFFQEKYKIKLIKTNDLWDIES